MKFEDTFIKMTLEEQYKQLKDYRNKIDNNMAIDINESNQFFKKILIIEDKMETLKALSSQECNLIQKYITLITFDLEMQRERLPAFEDTFTKMTLEEQYEQLKDYRNKINNNMSIDINESNQFFKKILIIKDKLETFKALSSQECNLLHRCINLIDVDLEMQEERSPAIDDSNGQGGPVDYPAAIALYEQALAKGNAFAMNNRGYMHYHGQVGLLQRPALCISYNQKMTSSKSIEMLPIDKKLNVEDKLQSSRPESP